MKTTFPSKLTTLRKGFTNEQGKFVCTGSYMGRVDTIPEEMKDRFDPIKLSLRKLKFVDGDYDEGGVYWGNFGNPIYRAVSSDGNVEIFIRAKDRNDAKRIVRNVLPNAKFFN